MHSHWHPATPVGPSWRDKMSHCKKQSLQKAVTGAGACSGGRQVLFHREALQKCSLVPPGALQPGAPKTPIPRAEPCQQLREPGHAAEQCLADINHFSPFYPFSFPTAWQWLHRENPLSVTEKIIEKLNWKQLKKSLFCLLHLPTYLAHKSQIITLETNNTVIVTFLTLEFLNVYWRSYYFTLKLPTCIL